MELRYRKLLKNISCITGKAVLSHQEVNQQKPDYVVVGRHAGPALMRKRDCNWLLMGGAVAEKSKALQLIDDKR